MKTLHLHITGRVQGVGYRAWAEREARRLALGGWIRNRRDGTVEMVVRGPAEIVDQIVKACRHGPSGANVRLVEISDHVGPVATEFVILPTR